MQNHLDRLGGRVLVGPVGQGGPACPIAALHLPRHARLQRESHRSWTLRDVNSRLAEVGGRRRSAQNSTHSPAQAARALHSDASQQTFSGQAARAWQPGARQGPTCPFSACFAAPAQLTWTGLHPRTGRSAGGRRACTRQRLVHI